MGDRGFAIIGAALVVALALFMGFGAVVVVERNHLIHAAKMAQQRISRHAHEDLRVTVENRNPLTVTVFNFGSSPSVLRYILVQRDDNEAPEVDGTIGSEDALSLGILDTKRIDKNYSVGERDNVAVVTDLGNTFWGD